MPEKKFKQVCECKNCGNEAEMQITCTLEEDKRVAVPKADETKADAAPAKDKVKGQSVCTHCGNEADMWLDVE